MIDDKLKELLIELDAEGLLVFVFGKQDKLSLLSYGKAFGGKLDLGAIAAGFHRAVEALIVIASIISPGTITPPKDSLN
jgi:hypothetical protein